MTYETLFESENYSVFRTKDDTGEFIEVCDGKLHMRYCVDEGIVVIEREDSNDSTE